MKYRVPICRNCGATIHYEDLNDKKCPNCQHEPLRIDYVIQEIDINDVEIEPDLAERIEANTQLLKKHYDIDILQEFRDETPFAAIWNYAGLIENLAIKTKLGYYVDINDVRENTIWFMKMLDALSQTT